MRRERNAKKMPEHSEPGNRIEASKKTLISERCDWHCFGNNSETGPIARPRAQLRDLRKVKQPSEDFWGGRHSNVIAVGPCDLHNVDLQQLVDLFVSLGRRPNSEPKADFWPNNILVLCVVHFVGWRDRERASAKRGTRACSKL